MLSAELNTKFMWYRITVADLLKQFYICFCELKSRFMTQHFIVPFYVSYEDKTTSSFGWSLFNSSYILMSIWIRIESFNHQIHYSLIVCWDLITAVGAAFRVKVQFSSVLQYLPGGKRVIRQSRCLLSPAANKLNVSLSEIGCA